jgi:RNA polymerase sigma factor (sigma-70 family)
MVCDAQLAEDVTQGAFLVLAQNARRLSDCPVISGWLHRTARNIAAKTVRTDVRRRAREQEAAAMSELSSAETDATWDEIAPQLDTALGELSDADRDALMLRYFERKSANEMAQKLGVSAEAAQKRVNRAVERLRECFVRRGVTVGASGLIALVSANAVQAAPTALAGSISTAAALAGTAAQASAAIAASETIAMTTTQKTLVAAIIAACLATPELVGYYYMKPGRNTTVPAIIASYQGDYQQTSPSKGWRYLWNAGGPVGDSASYASLQWDGRRYSPMSPPAYPGPAPVRYLRLTEAGGHPGQGMDQGQEVGNSLDRFVIAAFTVTEAGEYWITNSAVWRNDGAMNGSVELRVFVNDREVGPLVQCEVREHLLFDRALGRLSRGDTIYVGVGPNKMDTNDSFGWDFAIAH